MKKVISISLAEEKASLIFDVKSATGKHYEEENEEIKKFFELLANAGKSKVITVEDAPRERKKRLNVVASITSAICAGMLLVSCHHTSSPSPSPTPTPTPTSASNLAFGTAGYYPINVTIGSQTASGNTFSLSNPCATSGVTSFSLSAGTYSFTAVDDSNWVAIDTVRVLSGQCNSEILTYALVNDFWFYTTNSSYGAIKVYVNNNPHPASVLNTWTGTGIPNNTTNAKKYSVKVASSLIGASFTWYAETTSGIRFPASGVNTCVVKNYSSLVADTTIVATTNTFTFTNGTHPQAFIQFQ